MSGGRSVTPEQVDRLVADVKETAAAVRDESEKRAAASRELERITTRLERLVRRMAGPDCV